MRQVGMQIGAERRLGTATFESVDPYTGEPWAVMPEATRADVEDAVRAARAAFDGEWSAMTGAARGRLIRRLGELITERADDLADAETRDNGKLLREMGGQVRSLPAWYEYYAGLADKIDGRVVDTGRGDFFGYVSREPVGVVAAILPWNSPLLLLTFKLAPALAAGCTMVAKPSEQAPVSIMLLAELFEQAGFPPGVFNTVSVASRQVGEWLVGLFYAPTIVADVSNDAMICQEEVFGPVLSVLKFGSEDEAVAIANDSRYGLAAGVWTRDIQRAFRVTKQLRVGTVWVNAYRTLNFAMPFGGVKASGFGRENGTEGLHEYLRDKAVWVELTGGTRDPFVLG